MKRARKFRYTELGAALALAGRCGEVLQGQGPEMQGAALADLVSVWISGHHPDLRDEVFEGWLVLVRKLNVVNAVPREYFIRQ